ncbi:MAG: helicase C-terminal domain-containing protein [Candidatus Nanopelagicales bacterium]
MAGRTDTDAAGAPGRAAVRSLADDLRRRDDDALRTLLELRPDLLHPVPADLVQLALRATTATSVVAALDRLDRWTLQVAEVLAVLDEPASATEVHAAFADPDGSLAQPVAEALQRLRARGLVWLDGGDDPGSEDGEADVADGGLRLVRTARDALGPYPCGLGPPGAPAHPRLAAYAADPSRLDAALADAPEAALRALHSLAAGPPVGSVAGADRPVSEASARTPVEWLLARDLLLPRGPDSVVLPREVGRALRRGVLVADPAHPPRRPTATGHTDPARADSTAGQQALRTVTAVAALLDSWAVAPPPVLRTRGLAVRDLTATARDLDVDEPTAALWVETAYAAGLLAGDDEADESWVPTATYDVWQALELPERWAVLARAWLHGVRVPGLVGGRDARDVRINALSEAAGRPRAAAVRAATLEVLAELGPGASADADEVRAVLDHRVPRQASRLRHDLVGWTLAEAEVLGVTGAGALSAPGRALLEASRAPAATAPGARPATGRGTRRHATWFDPDAATAMAPLLPDPVDHVLLQADLTAVAPGPLEPSLARELALLAEVESTGGATVYRIGESSVRRALDAGRDAAGIVDFLERHSRTPVPQALRYLVQDTARRHGSVRVGTASSYVRSDDETALTLALTDRRAASLGLVRLAPTVLAAAAPVDEVLHTLRSIGLAPVAEAPDGAVVLRRPEERRTEPRPEPTATVGPPPASPTLVSAAVRALRAGDRAATAPRGQVVTGPAGSGHVPRTSTATTLEALRAAVEAEAPLWLGYADSGGAASERVVEPLRLAGGFLTAYDHRADEVRTFAVARITGVAPLDA